VKALRTRFRAGALACLLVLSLLPAASRADELEGGRPSPERSRNLKVLGLSLLVPGLGHVSEGMSRRGVPFMVAEAGFWTAFAVFRTQGALRRDSYVEMARLDAGISRPEGRDEEYYQLIGAWPSSDEYDAVIRRQARSVYGDDLEGRAAYFAAHQVAEDEAWHWESYAAQRRYRMKRIDSQNSFRRARTMVALAAANRVAAVLDFALLAPKAGRGDRAFHLECLPGPGLASARLALRCDLP